MTQPNFLYIGIARAASTWLFEALRHHPEVFVPPAKDLYFFDKHYEKGMGWYSSFFEGAGDAVAVGELSHDYYFSEEAAQRIKADLPDVKIILCLREPADRLISGYRYNKTTHIAEDVSFEDYVRDPESVQQLDYPTAVSRYMELFGRGQVLVVFFEDLKTNPAAFIEQIYRFLGVDTDFQPPQLYERVNAARSARIGALALFAFGAAQVMRRLGLANVVGRVKQSVLFNRLLYRAPKTSEGEEKYTIPPDVAAVLAENTRQLAEMLDRPLPDSWHG